MHWKANKWIAGMLGLVLQPIGMLYVAKPRWALFYFLLPLLSILAIWLVINQPLFTGAIAVALSLICAGHAFIAASIMMPLTQRPWYTRWYAIIGACITTIALIFSFRALAWEPFHIPSVSMSPALNPGDYIWVQKWGTPLERGQLLVFRAPLKNKNILVKRLVGLPGDKIQFDATGITLNGTKITRQDSTTLQDENTASEQTFVEILGNIKYTVIYHSNDNLALNIEGNIVVPEDHYFMLGDNRDRSMDSRHWGVIRGSDILGHPVTPFKSQ